MDTEAESSVVHQVAALIVSIVIFVVAWFLSGFLLGLLDQFRGLGDSWIQSVFRDVFAPWVGGYLGVVSALSWLSRSTPKFVFFGFSAALFLLIGAYLGLVGANLRNIDISVGTYIWGALSFSASIVGAYFGAASEGLEL